MNQKEVGLCQVTKPQEVVQASMSPFPRYDSVVLDLASTPTDGIDSRILRQ